MERVTKFDFDDVITAMSAVVSEVGGDFVYTKRNRAHDDGGECISAIHCVYVHNGEPDCLIGRILSKLGFTTAELESLKNRAVDIHSHSASANAIFGLFTNKARRAMRAAQLAQDSGAPWDRCLMRAAMTKV